MSLLFGLFLLGVSSVEMFSPQLLNRQSRFVSLVDGATRGSGNVYATNPATGVYGPVCGHNWSIEDANVVCHQLGYPLGAESFQTDSYYGKVSDDFSYGAVQCSGSEAELDECPHENQSDCNYLEGAGVVCLSDDKPKVVLVGGETELSGNVYALNPATGIYGPVCDDNWDIEDANVVCRQLGHLPGAISFQTDSYYGQVSDDFSYDEVQCLGSEVELDECAHDDQNDCKNMEGAGVVCAPENKIFVVLIGGETPSSGNVYAINTNTGIYGPVCDDNWDIEDANVVCRQLGYLLGAESFQTDSYYGKASDYFSYDEVQCTGSESELDECPHENQDDCNYLEAAGVVCKLNN